MRSIVLVFALAALSANQAVAAEGMFELLISTVLKCEKGREEVVLSLGKQNCSLLWLDSESYMGYAARAAAMPNLLLRICL